LLLLLYIIIFVIFVIIFDGIAVISLTVNIHISFTVKNNFNVLDQPPTTSRVVCPGGYTKLKTVIILGLS